MQEADWDAVNQQVRKKYPGSVRVNNLILQKHAEASDSLAIVQTDPKTATIVNVRKQIKPRVGPTFFFKSVAFIDNMRKSGKYNRVKTDESRIKNFKTFLKDQDIAFADITIPLLNRFRRLP